MKIKLEKTDLEFGDLTLICGENNAERIYIRGSFSDTFSLGFERASEIHSIEVNTFKKIAKNKSFIAKGEQENPLYKEIISLFRQILGGKFIVTDDIEFLPRLSKETIPLKEISHFVCSLCLLDYYIFNMVKIGETLIIDEPELHLHPKNQILMARLLVLLVNASVKVIITTHSDYIVRELSNCIMLDNLSEAQIQSLKKQGYSKEYALPSKRVKAYLVENIKGKNTLREVKITQEQGIFMETFDEPIDSQNENQGLIFEEAMRSNIHKNPKLLGDTK
ncbi:hypothetical protein LS72_010010 [Helicobacter apodemus]|uniref:Endonuclease GajA/Old nuclease/RecF-like AAA domain-containing protein n=1 Tax=Helicobacter apodemus TaxID=135569 RepID=A0A4V6I6C8_9HELI|nr:AAA family ATPase [Helicobacter apodemus]TLE13383.1 hypothetical protein LS72_010010 [Helicobacter apodemus]